jgi:hypothetical protein
VLEGGAALEGGGVALEGGALEGGALDSPPLHAMHPAMERTTATVAR